MVLDNDETVDSLIAGLLARVDTEAEDYDRNDTIEHLAGWIQGFYEESIGIAVASLDNREHALAIALITEQCFGHGTGLFWEIAERYVIDWEGN